MKALARYFEVSRGSSSGPNIPPMEGLRGFAVFLVFLVHYSTLVQPRLSDGSLLFSTLAAVHRIGNTGVDLFFVLSGYLIYAGLITRDQSFYTFMSRRIVRIYPTFSAVFLLYIVLSIVFPAESKIPSSPLAGFTYLLQNYLLMPGMFPIPPMITVAWSLSYEMFWYAALPLVVGLLGLRRRTGRWRSAFWLASAAALLIVSARYGGPVRIVMFVAGVLVYEAFRSERLSSPASGISAVLGVVGLLSTLLPIAYVARIAILFLTFSILCLCCFRRPHSWLGRAFSWTPLRWLGNMSYSYYLLHGLALKAAFLVLDRAWPPAPASAGAVVVGALLLFGFTLLPSTALFLVVERPYSLHARTGPSYAIGTAGARVG